MSGKGKANPKAAAKPAAPLSKKAKKDKDEESKAAAAAAADDDAMSSGTESDDIDDDGDDSDDDSDDGLDMTREGGDDEEEEESEDEDEDNVVNVEFNFMDPREIHFKSVRRLLEHYLPGEEETFNVSAMADAIVAQTAVGTMVTVNDDLDVYSFATVLPVALYKVSKRATERRWRGATTFSLLDIERGALYESCRQAPPGTSLFQGRPQYHPLSLVTSGL